MVFYNEVSYTCNSDTSWNGEVDFFHSMLYVANYFAEKRIQKLSKNIKVLLEQKAKKKKKIIALNYIHGINIGRCLVFLMNK